MKRKKKVSVRARNETTNLVVVVTLEAERLTASEMATACREMALHVVRGLPGLKYVGLDELDVVR
jgi:hypothetical protein